MISHHASSKTVSIDLNNHTKYTTYFTYRFGAVGQNKGDDIKSTLTIRRLVIRRLASVTACYDLVEVCGDRYSARRVLQPTRMEIKKR